MKTRIILLCLLFFGNSAISAECDIECIIDSMKDPGMTHLVIHELRLSKENMVSIGRALNGSRITSLDFSHNGIGPEVVEVLADYLKDSQITSLNLAWNFIENSGAKAIARVLNRTRITFLDLAHNSLEFEEGIGAIARVLPNTSITHLDVQRNTLKPRGIEALAAGLIASRMTTLELGLTAMYADGARALATVLDRTRITKLGLEGNKFGDEGTKAIAGVLNKTAITSLNLYMNDLGSDEGVRALTGVLNGTKITELDLGRNIIGDEALEMFVNNLRRTAITHLDLHRIGMSSRNVQALVDGLKRSRVTHLRVSANEMAPENAKILISGLEESRISHLSVGQNFFGNKGDMDIIGVLNRTGITHLDFSANEANDETGMAFVSILNDTQVVDLDLSYNNINITVLDRIESELQSNRKRLNKTYQQFADFVVNENGSLGFNVDKAFVNVFDYIEFAGIVGRKKRAYSNLFYPKDRTNFTEEQVEDLIRNIEWRLSECFAKADYVYQEFEKFVKSESGFLSFNVRNAYTNRSEYDEFARVIAGKKEIFIHRFSTEGRLDYSRSQIQDFVENIETRLSECSRKTDLVYRAFISFVFDKNDGPDLSAHDAEIVSNKESWINCLMSKGDGTYSRDQVEDFIRRL